jgi:predicted Zn finger-like uncharacterized protein
MSMITRCPACGTMFKVVPDQLRISEGWVRCGHCAEVFDASANLQAEDAASAAANRPAAVEQPHASDASGEAEEFASSLNTEYGDGMALGGPDSAQLDAEAQALTEHPLDRPFELRREDISPIEDRPTQVALAAEPQRKKPEPEPELHDLSFVKQARREAFWRGPVVRLGLLVSLVLLGLMLLMQFALHERDRLAASDPALRTLLARLCEPLKCSIRPPRQIDAISIDSSSFNKLPGEAYRLNLTLKNQATMPVAMPALELTLTDGQDQPVVRRVLMPADLGATAAVIGATSEWSGSLELAVANGNGSRIAGYRLLAFYP